jgi:hypothetical protein
MGISLTKTDPFTIKDDKGNTRFSLNGRMPHIIHNLSGNVTIPTVLINQFTGEEIVNRTDVLAIIANTYISSDSANNFILPLVSITGGIANTNSKIMPAIGSTLLRKIQGEFSSEFIGGTILDFIADDGNLKIVCNQFFNRTSNPTVIGDDTISISYRVYYGRFN